MVGDLEVGLEVALAAVWRPVEVGAGNADAAAASAGAAAADQRAHVGHAVLAVVRELDAAARPAHAAPVRRAVHDQHRVGRTGGVEVLPLTHLVQRPLCMSHIHAHVFTTEFGLTTATHSRRYTGRTTTTKRN